MQHYVRVTPPVVVSRAVVIKGGMPCGVKCGQGENRPPSISNADHVQQIGRPIIRPIIQREPKGPQTNSPQACRVFRFLAMVIFVLQCWLFLFARTRLELRSSVHGTRTRIWVACARFRPAVLAFSTRWIWWGRHVWVWFVL